MALRSIGVDYIRIADIDDADFIKRQIGSDRPHDRNTAMSEGRPRGLRRAYPS